MTDDQIIDKILSALSDADPGALTVASFIKHHLDLDEFAYPKYVDRLEAEGLADALDPRHRMVITDFGRQVQDAGGWLAHVDRLAADRQSQDDIERIQTDKLRNDAIMSKWYVKMRWWPLIVSALSLIVSIVAIVLSLKSTDRQEWPPEQPYTTPTTSTSDQTKTAVPMPKTKIDTVDDQKRK